MSFATPTPRGAGLQPAIALNERNISQTAVSWRQICVPDIRPHFFGLFRAGRWPAGESQLNATILPGFMMFLGSSARLIEAITASAATPCSLTRYFILP